MSLGRLIYILTLFWIVGHAVGCQSTVNLKLDDRDRFIPDGRVSYEFLPGNDQRRAGTLFDLVTGTTVTTESAKIQPTISIEGAVAGVRSSDHQQIAAGERAELDVVIPGPARVKVKADSLRAHVAVRGGVRFFDILTLEAILGLGLDNTEVRLRGPGSDTSDEDLQVGFLFGGRGTIRPIPLFDLYAQYTYLLVPTTNFFGLDTEIEDAQVGIELNLTRNLSVFTGYRWWTYAEENLASGSDFDIDIRGPTAGASLKF